MATIVQSMCTIVLCIFLKCSLLHSQEYDRWMRVNNNEKQEELGEFLKYFYQQQQKPHMNWKQYCDQISSMIGAEVDLKYFDEAKASDAIQMRTALTYLYRNGIRLANNIRLPSAYYRHPESSCNTRKLMIKELGKSRSCADICYQCFPGSMSICHMLNRSFPTLGKTCLCKYSDMDEPVFGVTPMHVRYL